MNILLGLEPRRDGVKFVRGASFITVRRRLGFAPFYPFNVQVSFKINASLI